MGRTGYSLAVKSPPQPGATESLLPSDYRERPKWYFLETVKQRVSVQGKRLEVRDSVLKLESIYERLLSIPETMVHYPFVVSRTQEARSSLEGETGVGAFPPESIPKEKQKILWKFLNRMVLVIVTGVY